MASDVLTIEEAKKGHRKLWTWLANHPEMGKQDWPGWGNNHESCAYCFACALHMGCHKFCPIAWPGKGGCYTTMDDSDTPFGLWERMGAMPKHDWNDKWRAERSRLATLIADLEWRV